MLKDFLTREKFIFIEFRKQPKAYKIYNQVSENRLIKMLCSMKMKVNTLTQEIKVQIFNF